MKPPRKLFTRNIIHIGIAVDTEAGLIVPVIRDVDKKSLARNFQGPRRTRQKSA